MNWEMYFINIVLVFLLPGSFKTDPVEVNLHLVSAAGDIFVFILVWHLLFVSVFIYLTKKKKDGLFKKTMLGTD